MGRKQIKKEDLLFYTAYEDFYTMASESEAFKEFCKEAFGEDFSQDGFSDIEQINRILPYIPKHDNVHILDIGCGNGKMLGYLQEKTGAYIHGFDYEVEDITAQTYKLLQKKRLTVMKYRTAFEAEGHGNWYEMLLGQTECVMVSFEQFKERMARYLYVARK